MSQNATFVSTISCAASDRTEGFSCSTDVESTVEKINQAIALLHVLEARLVLLEARIIKAKESKKKNETSLGDATEVSQTYYDRAMELWTAAQNYKIRIQNETNKFINGLAPGLLGGPSQNPQIELFRKKILEYGNTLTPLCILQKEMADEKEQLDLNMVEKQKEMVELIAEVGDKLEQADTQGHPREIQKSNERLMKAKIARCIINSILASSRIDYEQNPDLLALRIKWRHPISLKFKAT